MGHARCMKRRGRPVSAATGREFRGRARSIVRVRPRNRRRAARGRLRARLVPRRRDTPWRSRAGDRADAAIAELAVARGHEVLAGYFPDVRRRAALRRRRLQRRVRAPARSATLARRGARGVCGRRAARRSTCRATRRALPDRSRRCARSAGAVRTTGCGRSDFRRRTCRTSSPTPSRGSHGAAAFAGRASAAAAASRAPGCGSAPLRRRRVPGDERAARGGGVRRRCRCCAGCWPTSCCRSLRWPRLATAAGRGLGR